MSCDRAIGERIHVISEFVDPAYYTATLGDADGGGLANDATIRIYGSVPFDEPRPLLTTIVCLEVGTVSGLIIFE